MTDPVAVFEIMSHGNATTDPLVKANEYWEIPSLRHYVLLEQDQVGAAVLTRGAARWELQAVLAGDSIRLPTLDIELPLDEIYEGLDLT